MKRIMSVILILVIISGAGVPAFAAKQERTTVEISDALSGKKRTLNVVNLLVGGKEVFSDVPAILYDSRTLVPIRFIVENIGAKIDWDNNTYEAKITMEDKTIVLKIDSAMAYVNGKKIMLPDGVPPKLLGYQGNYRTMVPLRFVLEQLNMDVNWIPQTLTATVDYPEQSIVGIEYDRNGAIPQVIIKTTGLVSTVPLYLEGSKYGGNDRLVLDIPNTVLDIKDPTIEVQDSIIRKDIGQDGITAIRGSIFETQPRNTSRVVIDLEERRGYNLYFDKESSEIRVQFLNNVTDIRIEKELNTDVVVIHTDEPPVYNIMDLGDRVVVDVLNAQLKFHQNEIPVSRGGIKRIRTGVFQPDINYDPNDKIVRVVLDLEEGQTAENLFIEEVGNDIFVYMNDKPLKGFDYRKESRNQALLEILLDEEGRYYIDYNNRKRELLLKVRKDCIELEEANFDIADALVDSIEIDDSRSSRYYYITMKLAEGTVYEVQSEKSVTDKVMVSFKNENIQDTKYDGKIIVLDAGHGGQDPGALGSNLKLQEKALALDTVLRLKKLLEEAGFTIYLTRKDDTYIGLYERTNLANELKADAFVSVHYNWHPDEKISGVQVLYNGDDPNRDNKTFARIVQEELLKELGAVDRKIVERPKLVVIRETKMPAVLAEMGFLSNREEEALIHTEAYRQKCAQALFNGITRYFDEVVLNEK